METEALEELGLSQGEVKTYLSLLELGEVKVGAIIENSRMASSAVHNSLNILIEKGLASYIKKGKIKFYKAVKPKQLLDFIELKKEKLQAIIPELEAKQTTSKQKQEAEIFEGSKGIISMLNDLIEDGKKGDKYLYFSLNVDQYNEEIQEFFSRHDMKRKEKELTVLGLGAKKVKQFMGKRRYINMKFTNMPIPEGIAICNDKVAIFSWEEKPVGYLIKSKQVSEMYTKLFENLWKIAKA
jgi:HTH-type transcriptional regulator, sugar sensing transcriptional regulator